MGLFSTVAHGRMLNEVVVVMVMPSKKLSVPNEQGVHTNPHKAALCYGLLKQGKVTHLLLNARMSLSMILPVYALSSE